ILLFSSIVSVPLFLLVVHHFFVTPPPATFIYPLSLHDALPIFHLGDSLGVDEVLGVVVVWDVDGDVVGHPVQVVHILYHVDVAVDRKSTRLNSSHVSNSYAVFCLKKKSSGTNMELLVGLGGSDA